MKERPIIFSGPMVQAILTEKKTQTRRIVKRPKNLDEKYYPMNAGGRWWWAWNGYSAGLEIICPYGYPHVSRLWVRETWATDIKWDRISPRIIPTRSSIWYRASQDEFTPGVVGRWRSSIHMPRWASRIILEVMNIRIERLQDINAEDCIAEGFNPVQRAANGITLIPAYQVADDITRLMFRQVWDKLNAKRGYNWYENPCVWVIDFKMLEGQQHGTY